jgi:hypothetical protein
MAQQPPGSFPQQPPGGYPQQPSGYPAAPVGYGAPSRSARPGSVTTAGVFLIILGSLAGLGGIAITLFAGILATADFGSQFGEQFGDQFGDIFRAAAGIVVVFGVIVIVYAVFKIIAGAKVLALKNGWRITGIVLCAIAMVGWVLSLIGAFTGGQEQSIDPTTFELTTVSAGPSIGGIIFSLVFLAANTLTLVLLARAGASFTRRP